MTDDEIHALVIRTIANHVNREPCELSENTNLKAIGTDSLDRVEIAMTLEGRLGNDTILTNNEHDGITVGDIIQEVKKAENRA